jgi:hypothetical protein
MTRFVCRDENGWITGHYAVAQHDGQQEMEDDALAAELADAARRAPARLTVSRLRLKLELAARGLLPEVDQAVQAAGAVPQIYWAEATEFESDHPLVLQIGTALGLSPPDVRALFEAAATREA